MLKTIHYTLYTIILSVLLTSCEVIPENERLIPVPLPDAGEQRHVLLEFTGFRCVNCPAAAETAASLQSLYGDNLIVIVLHPASNPFTQGAYDYTCPEADSIYRFMGGTATTPFPTGNIDMRLFDDSYFIGPDQWTTQLVNIIQSPITDIPSPITSYWLVEDSVLGVQAMPDGSVNMNYYHRHVLRAISEQPFQQLPEQCNPAHCTVVTMQIDPNDKHIINAYETALHLSSDY